MKKRILIKGRKVHDVAYRLFLMNLAGDIGIENFNARNIKEKDRQVVKVLVESSGDNINKFFNIVREPENFPEHADVDSDSISIEDYGDYIGTLDSFRLGFMVYQQSKFANAAVGLLGEFKEFRMESGEKQDKTLEKLDKMLEHTSRIPNIEANTSKIPKIEENTSKIPNIEANTSKILENTSKIPDIEENTSEMKDSLSQLIPKITVIEEEQEVMKKDIVRIKERIGIAA